MLMQDQAEVKLILLCPDNGFSNQVIEAIGDSPIQFWSAHTRAKSEHLLETVTPDLVLSTEDTDWAEPIFSALRTRVPNEQPLIISLSDRLPKPTHPSVDMWLPYSALASLPIHLNNALVWRQQLLDQKMRCAQLETTRERLENEIQMQQQSSFAMLEQIKNAVVYNVTHELRTPLLQVKSAVSLLGDAIDREDSTFQLAIIALGRLDTGIRNLGLLNSLIQAGLDRESFTVTPVTDIVESATHYVKRIWEHREQLDRLKVKYENKLLPIACDPKRLSLALGLIMDNALKFSKKRVNITIQPVPGGVRFTVKDQGIGIPAAQLMNIFDIFYQVDGSITRRYNGMGIGLAIARHIVESHGSTIHVNSDEGKGTTFSFDIYDPQPPLK